MHPPHLSSLISHTSSRGFTLVEMVVALGVFSVVAVVALGALTKIVAANKKAQTLQSAVTNLTYSLESMSREMRTGRNYVCDTRAPESALPSPQIENAHVEPDCAVPSMLMNGDKALIAFQSTRTSSDGACNLITAYRFVEVSTGAYTLQKAEQEECDQTITSDIFADLIDPQVVITDYHVSFANGDHQLGFIQIAGYVGVADRERTTFNIQTAISSRVP